MSIDDRLKIYFECASRFNQATPKERQLLSQNEMANAHWVEEDPVVKDLLVQFVHPDEL